MDTQKIQSTLEFKAFMQDLMEKPPEEIMGMSQETIQKFLGFCKELISDFYFPISFYQGYSSMQSEDEVEIDFWIYLVELEADMKCRVYLGTKSDLPNRRIGRLCAEYDAQIFLIYLLSACGKTGIKCAGIVPDTRSGFPSENIVQWTPLMKIIRNLGIG